MIPEYTITPRKKLLVDKKIVSVFTMADKNIDFKTVQSFGEEWLHFSDFSDDDIQVAGDEYFDIVPSTIYTGKYVLDIGCGTGRWSKYLSKKVTVVLITSDKVYKNLELKRGYKENDILGGYDPYSASKASTEILINSYIKSFFNKKNNRIFISIARAGNVIGGGDWSENRLVPDSVRAWSKGKKVLIRNPKSTRPWQHVLEPLSGYLMLAVALTEETGLHGEAYNFGPSDDLNHPVSDLIDEMSKYWDHVRWNDISKLKEHVHEAGLLKLNCDKALFDLNWRPTLQFSKTVKMTVEWYKYYYQNSNQSMYDFTVSQIDEYTELAKVQDISWSY